jgi:cytochrome c oxidase subunit 2
VNARFPRVGRAGRVGRIATALGVVLAAGGCSSTHSIVAPHASEAHTVAGVWWIVFGIAAAVYVIVAGLVIFAATRNRRVQREHEGFSEHRFIWLGGLLGPFIILMFVAGMTVHTTSELRNPSRGELVVKVVGRRWWWDVDYPAAGVRTANEIHIPEGQPVDIELTTDDVIHSFWVPSLAGKLDTIPNQVNHLRFTADKVGRYRGFCAEYCGIQHAHMDFFVVVDTPADFGRWEAQNAQPAGDPTDDEQATGAVVFQRLACAGCHTIRGTPAVGDVGPDLTHVGSRSTLAALTIPNDASHLAEWISKAQTVKPGALMPNIAMSDGQRAALVAYLENLK